MGEVSSGDENKNVGRGGQQDPFEGRGEGRCPHLYTLPKPQDTLVVNHERNVLVLLESCSSRLRVDRCVQLFAVVSQIVRSQDRLEDFSQSKVYC